MRAATEAVRVLLVEDNVADSTLILEVFKDEKIAADVSVVTDGKEAMQFLNRLGQYANARKPDLVILDLNMPGMDGREVLKEMKSAPGLETIPVVVLTTSSAEQDILESYKLQASCYITKPINLEQFIKVVRSIDSFWFTAVHYPHEQ